MNNKGFMMAEVIVVSSIVLVTLVGLYTSYSKIFTLYNQRINYYDVATLYELAYIRDNELENLERGCNKFDGDMICFISKNEFVDVIDNSSLNITFKEYLNYLSTSIDFNSLKLGERTFSRILFMENCDNSENNCKYAYLEVPDDE